MNVQGDSYVDLLRKVSGCPDGKSLRLHIEELRAQVEKLEGVRRAAEVLRDAVNADRGDGAMNEFAMLEDALAACEEVGE